MKSALASIFLSIVSFYVIASESSALAKWEVYDKTWKDKIIRYYDETSIVRDGPIVRVYVKYEFKEKVEMLEDVLTVSSVLLSYELECREKQYRTLLIEGYSLPHLKGIKTLNSGESLENEKEQMARWQSIKKHSHFQSLMGKVCS